jgi:hypothetical protein
MRIRSQNTLSLSQGHEILGRRIQGLLREHSLIEAQLIKNQVSDLKIKNLVAEKEAQVPRISHISPHKFILAGDVISPVNLSEIKNLR